MATKTSTKKKADRRLRRVLRRLGAVLLVCGLAAAWMWQRTLPLERVAVVGAVHTPPEAVVELVDVEPDSTALFSLSPSLLASRAERHPWVRTASVRRLPTGTLRVKVEERTPVALALDAAGRPNHFLDADGYRMPVSAAAPTLYDVPVLHGAPAYHPTQPVDGGLASLLAALGTADAETLALVSEVEWGRRVTLWTTPAGGHGSVPVRLGAGADADHAGQLRRLRAFWDQSVLPRPEATFRLVDLRFDGQVVTREGAPPEAAPPAAPEADSTATSPSLIASNTPSQP